MRAATIVALCLVAAAPSLAQTAPPTEAELRTALDACSGHWQLAGKGPVSTWTRQWDSGFEHCETLRSGLMDAVAASHEARRAVLLDGRNAATPAPPSADDIAASKAVAARIKP